MVDQPKGDKLATSHQPHNSKKRKEPSPEVAHSLTKKPEEPRTLNDLAKIYYNRPEQGVVRKGSDESPSVFLSRFGLKTPESLDKFLRTPAGKEVITEMTEELAIEKSIEEYRRIEQRDHDLMMRRIKIAIFLYFLEKKAHASDKVKEWIRELNEKSLERQKVEPKTNLPEDTQRKVDLQEAISKYTKAISSAQTNQSLLKDDEEHLLAELATLERLSEQLIAKYGLYEAHVHDDHFTAYMNTDGTINTQDIALAHAELEAQMKVLYDQINELVENDEDPTLLMQEQNALNLKFATLHDMLAVDKGTKYYADEHGVEIPKDSPSSRLQDAAFILNREDKLIFDNGQYYLLKPSQNWDTVKNSTEARAEALKQGKENFDRSKAEIMTVKKVVNHNRGMEETAHNSRSQDKHFALSLNHAEQRLVENQIRLLQSARSEAQASLTAPTPSNRPSVSPTVTLRSSFQSAPRPSPQSTMLSYKQELEKVKQMQELTQDALLSLAGKAPGAANQANARLYIQSLFASGGQRMSALPAQYRAQLFQRMEQFGVEGPLTQQREAKTQSYTSPSPFSMTPDPYKK